MLVVFPYMPPDEGFCVSSPQSGETKILVQGISATIERKSPEDRKLHGMTERPFQIDAFPRGVDEVLKDYVYALCRPNGMVFYIGRGVGGRVFSHAREALALEPGVGTPSQKHQAILDMLSTGESGKAFIVAYGMTTAEAKKLEAVLISFSRTVLVGCMEGDLRLTNKVRGEGGHSCMLLLEDVVETLAPERVAFGGKRLLLLSFNSQYDPELRPVYRRQAHPHFTHCWDISESSVSGVEFVVAVAGGIIRSVCRPTRWFQAPREKGVGLAFEGVVDDEFSEEWVGKALPKDFGFAPQNPTRYWPPRERTKRNRP